MRSFVRYCGQGVQPTLDSSAETFMSVHTRITNPRWQTAAILEKLKNSHISAAVQRILTQFGTMMHFEPLDRTDRQKFEILQIQDGGGRHLENLKIVISQPRFERFQQNLVR